MLYYCLQCAWMSMQLENKKNIHFSRPLSVHSPGRISSYTLWSQIHGWCHIGGSASLYTALSSAPLLFIILSPTPGFSADGCLGFFIGQADGRTFQPLMTARKKNLVTLPEPAQGFGLNVNQGHLSADPLGLSCKTLMQPWQIQPQSLSLHLTYQLSVPVFTHMTQRVLEVYYVECL